MNFSSKYKYFVRAPQQITHPNGAIAIFSDYLSRYPNIIRDSIFYPKSFINEIRNASYQMQNNSRSGCLLDLTIQPAVRPGEKYGMFYYMIKIETKYYTVNYNRFQQYEYDFINSSNDLKEKQLVGLAGIWSYGKLKRIKKDDPYTVFLPIEIKYW
jgi:hypothetical protein